MINFSSTSSIKIRGYLEKLLVCRNIPKLSQGFTKQQKEPWQRVGKEAIAPTSTPGSSRFPTWRRPEIPLRTRLVIASDSLWTGSLFGVRVRFFHPFPKQRARSPAMRTSASGSLLRHRLSWKLGILIRVPSCAKFLGHKSLKCQRWNEHNKNGEPSIFRDFALLTKKCLIAYV